MGRILFGLLFIVALVAGSPYVALALGSIMGTSSATFTDYDGSVQTLTIGRNVPQPDWFPGLPGSLLVKASRWAASTRALDGGGSELLVHEDPEKVSRFYLDALREQGFTSTDVGTGPLNAGAAAFMGIAGMLKAERAATGHEISITIRTPDGILLRPRLVQINWMQYSPEQKKARDAARAAANAPK